MSYNPLTNHLLTGMILQKSECHPPFPRVCHHAKTKGFLSNLKWPPWKRKLIETKPSIFGRFNGKISGDFSGLWL